jgi:outer membrane protein
MRVLALLLLFFSIQAYAENIKIGYINIDEVIENSSLYRLANNELEKVFQPRKDELLALYDNINNLKAKLKLPNDIVDDLVYHQDLKKIQTLNDKFDSDSEIWQRQLNQSQFNLLAEIEYKINQVINSYASLNNYDLILYENIAFVSDELNITEIIIAEIEKL